MPGTSETYLAGSSLSLPSRFAARTIRPVLRRWDVMTAKRAGVIVAISETVRERIRTAWGRESDAVIYPPVDTAEIHVSERDDGFLLVAARLLAYRRVDLAVTAATRLGRELVVVGDGPAAPPARGGGRAVRPIPWPSRPDGAA